MIVPVWKKLSYKEVPALSVRRGHLRRALRTVTLAWMFGVAWLAACSGSHVRVLTGLMGFNDLAFGILAAVPFLATFGQVIASSLIERTGLVKYQFIHFAAVHRLLWLVVALLPFVLPIPSQAAVVTMLVVLSASWFMSALATPAWMTWMGLLIPRRVRGRYFAHRERLALMIQVPIVIAVGACVDVLFPASDPGGTALGLWFICGIIAIGSALGVVDVLLFRRVPELCISPSRLPGGSQEPPGQATPMPPGSFLFDYVLDPLRDSNFRSYVLFAATMTFSVTVGGWFFWLNAMDNLGFGGLGANVLFLVIGPVAGIFSSRWWGRAIDRWGRRPILFVGTAGAVLCVVPWLLITREMSGPAFLTRTHAWAISIFGGESGTSAPVGAFLAAALASALGGVAWNGVNLAQIGVVLSFADGNGRSRYVAAASVLISVGGVLGAFTGGLLVESLRLLQETPLRLGPFVWNNWHVAFAAAMLVRCLALLWLVGMPDPGAARIRVFTRHMGVNVSNAVLTRLFYPVRIFGWTSWRKQPSRNRNGCGSEEADEVPGQK